MQNIVFLKGTEMIDFSKGDLQNTRKTDASSGAVVQNPRVRRLISPAPERKREVGLWGEISFLHCDH